MSLRLRLAFWSGGLVGLAMLLVGLVAYAVHGHAFYDDVDLVLRNGARHALEEIDRSTTTGQLRSASPDVAVRAYSSSGQVVAASSNAQVAPAVDPLGALPTPGSPYDWIVGLAPPFTSVDPGPGAFGLAGDPSGARWRVYLLPAGHPEARYVLAAAPLDRADAAVQGYRRLVAILSAAGAAVTAIAGWLVADRTLRPVAALTETAAAITHSTRFSRRVQIDVGRDELGRLATTFNEMLASLEKAYKAQQRFVADASHELRAPLTAIQANLELLMRRPNMSEAERDEAVREAAREANRLTRLVADLLALARADAGVPLRRENVELDRALLEVLGEARHLARGQQIEVESLEPVVIKGDPDRVKQLLLVLLDNALKYTPPSGRVTLALRRDGQSAEIAVRDTGLGIAAEDLPRIFERFYRADPARARDPGGTGLGLSIARWIALEHGGDVTLASEPGQGTTARVRLPAD